MEHCQACASTVLTDRLRLLKGNALALKRYSIAQAERDQQSVK